LRSRQLRITEKLFSVSTVWSQPWFAEWAPWVFAGVGIMIAAIVVHFLGEKLLEGIRYLFGLKKSEESWGSKVVIYKP